MTGSYGARAESGARAMLEPGSRGTPPVQALDLYRPVEFIQAGRKTSLGRGERESVAAVRCRRDREPVRRGHEREAEAGGQREAVRGDVDPLVERAWCAAADRAERDHEPAVGGQARNRGVGAFVEQLQVRRERGSWCGRLADVERVEPAGCGRAVLAAVGRGDEAVRRDGVVAQRRKAQIGRGLLLRDPALEPVERVDGARRRASQGDVDTLPGERFGFDRRQRRQHGVQEAIGRLRENMLPIHDGVPSAGKPPSTVVSSCGRSGRPAFRMRSPVRAWSDRHASPVAWYTSSRTSRSIFARSSASRWSSALPYLLPPSNMALRIRSSVSGCPSIAHVSRSISSPTMYCKNPSLQPSVLAIQVTGTRS